MFEKTVTKLYGCREFSRLSVRELWVSDKGDTFKSGQPSEIVLWWVG